MIKTYLHVILWTVVFGAGCCTACAQSTGDTIPYKITSYTEKKSGVHVYELAQKLKVKAALMVKLNNFNKATDIIPRGAVLQVPVYSNAKNSKAHSTKHPGEPARKEVADTISKPAPMDEKANIELQKNRLLLVDATLELNQTLLQGVDASIDTLNVEDKPLGDHIDAQARVHEMERERDKIVIKPYLWHIRDSLRSEISHEEKEKRDLESGLGVNKPVETADISGADKSSPGSTENKKISEAATGKSSAKTASGKKHYQTARALPSVTETFFLQGLRDVEPLAENNPPAHPASAAAYTPHPKPPAEIDNSDGDVNRSLRDSINLLKSQLLFTRATEAFREHNSFLAEDCLEKAVDFNPRYYDAWFALADLHLQNAYPAKAFSEFKICEQINNRSAKLYFKLGNSAFRSDHKTEAIQYFQRSLAIDSNFAQSLLALGQAYSEGKQYNEAVSEFNRALAVNPEYHSALKSRGIAEYMLGKYTSAIEDLNAYLIFKENDGGSYFYRGVAEVANKDAKGGCADLQKALQLNFSLAQKALDKHCAGNK